MAGSELQKFFSFGLIGCETVIITFIIGAPVVPMLFYGWGALVLGLANRSGGRISFSYANSSRSREVLPTRNHADPIIDMRIR